MNYEDKDKRSNPSDPANKKQDNKGSYSSEKGRDSKDQRQQDQPTKRDRDADKTKGQRPEYGSEGRADKSNDQSRKQDPRENDRSKPNIKFGEKEQKGQQGSDKPTQGESNWKKPR